MRFKTKTIKRKLAMLMAYIHYLLLQDLIGSNSFNKIETSIIEPLLLPKTITPDTYSKDEFIFV